MLSLFHSGRYPNPIHYYWASAAIRKRAGMCACEAVSRGILVSSRSNYLTSSCSLLLLYSPLHFKKTVGSGGRGEHSGHVTHRPYASHDHSEVRRKILYLNVMEFFYF